MLKKRLAAVLPLLSLGIFAGVIVSSADAATCSGKGCEGLDPDKTGCAKGAYALYKEPIQRKGVTVGSVELRWSPTCQTVWSRVTSNAGNRYLKAHLLRPNDAGDIYPNFGYSSLKWSRMKYAPKGGISLRACGVIGTEPNTEGALNCTRYR